MYYSGNETKLSDFPDTPESYVLLLLTIKAKLIQDPENSKQADLDLEFKSNQGNFTEKEEHH